MSEVGMNIETVRQSFRPAKITTLFVGESAPASGDFWRYYTSRTHPENQSSKLSNMRAFGKSGSGSGLFRQVK
jgi:hypothetical protein